METSNDLEEKKENEKWKGEIKPYSSELQKDFFLFCKKMWPQLGRPWDPEKFQKDLLDIPGIYQKDGGNFWIARTEEEIVGCAGLKALNPEMAEFVRFYVLAENRGQKIGAELLHTALHAAMQGNFKQVVLDTDSKKSVRAIEVFTSVGFKEIPPYKETPFSDLFFGLDLKNFICPFCKS